MIIHSVNQVAYAACDNEHQSNFYPKTSAVHFEKEYRKQIYELDKEYLEKAITQTRKKLYEEYESDACGLGRLLYIFKPSFYRKNEKNIDSVMQDSIFEVDVDLKIRRIGHEFIEMDQLLQQ